MGYERNKTFSLSKSCIKKKIQNEIYFGALAFLYLLICNTKYILLYRFKYTH